MARCAGNRHKWVLIFVSGKTWVCCGNCSDRFPFSPEFNGATYNGAVPEKYRRENP